MTPHSSQSWPICVNDTLAIRHQYTNVKNLSAKIGGASIYLKREDLNHTGSHKINHCLGEALLAKKMGNTKLIAETGAGQHGASAACCIIVIFLSVI